MPSRLGAPFPESVPAPPLSSPPLALLSQLPGSRTLPCQLSPWSPLTHPAAQLQGIWLCPQPWLLARLPHRRGKPFRGVPALKLCSLKPLHTLRSPSEEGDGQHPSRARWIRVLSAHGIPCIPTAPWQSGGGIQLGFSGWGPCSSSQASPPRCCWCHCCCRCHHRLRALVWLPLWALGRALPSLGLSFLLCSIPPSVLSPLSAISSRSPLDFVGRSWGQARVPCRAVIQCSELWVPWEEDFPAKPPSEPTGLGLRAPWPCLPPVPGTPLPQAGRGTACPSPSHGIFHPTLGQGCPLLKQAQHSPLPTGGFPLLTTVQRLKEADPPDCFP